MPSRTKSASVDASQQDVEMVDAVAEPVVDGDDREGEEYDRDVAQKIKIVCLFTILFSQVSKAAGAILLDSKIIPDRTSIHRIFN